MKTGYYLIFLFFVSILNAQTFFFDFTTGYEGWDGNFADYPVGAESDYELEFERTALPAYIDSTQKALRISGLNRSDDLFMYIYKQISGLQPHRTYSIKFSVEFASNAPTNAQGVGGVPGEGVTMKAGAVLYQPDRLISYDHGYAEGYYVMNLDKGNQVLPGADMDTIGHVGVTDTTTRFALKTNTNDGHPFTITTDSAGTVWLIIGTDSGYEGKTTLYYNRITAVFEIISAISAPGKEKPSDFFLAQNYPNPFNPSTVIRYQLRTSGMVELSIYDIAGRKVHTLVNRTQKAGSHTVEFKANGLSSGAYFYKLSFNGNTKAQKMILMQ